MDEQGRPARLVGADMDITARKLAQQQLEESKQALERRVEERTADLSIANAELVRASRAKDEFLSTMSHELHTPLNAVLNLSESLQEGTYGPLEPAQANALTTIRESGEHLLELINDILDLSKAESGRMELQTEPVVLQELVDWVLHLVNPSARKKRLSISTTLANAPGAIPANSRCVRQMLVNLLSNAVKFTPEGGQIGLEITPENAGDALRFTVWDTGIGIAPDKISQLFQPFVQLDSSLSRAYTGTGLGLALVRRMAELHRGSVGVESRPGQGSRFWFILPLPQALEPGCAVAAGAAGSPPETNSAKITPESAQPDQGALILFAEDNLINLESYTDYLQGKGFRVIPAANGYEAIQLAQEFKPDLILMDIHMPVMDGLEAIHGLRAIPKLARVPILALTALVMPGDRERCLAAGANAYLAKPVSLKQLCKDIHALLAR